MCVAKILKIIHIKKEKYSTMFSVWDKNMKPRNLEDFSRDLFMRAIISDIKKIKLSR